MDLHHCIIVKGKTSVRFAAAEADEEEGEGEEDEHDERMAALLNEDLDVALNAAEEGLQAAKKKKRKVLHIIGLKPPTSSRAPSARRARGCAASTWWG